MHQQLLNEFIFNLKRLDNYVEVNNGLIWINSSVSISFIVSRCFIKSDTNFQWLIRFEAGLNPDITVAARMQKNNTEILDYYIIPHMAVSEKILKLNKYEHFFWEAYRFDNLDFLYKLIGYMPLKQVI